MGFSRVLEGRNKKYAINVLTAEYETVKGGGGTNYGHMILDEMKDFIDRLKKSDDKVELSDLEVETVNHAYHEIVRSV